MDYVTVDEENVINLHDENESIAMQVVVSAEYDVPWLVERMNDWVEELINGPS